MAVGGRPTVMTCSERPPAMMVGDLREPADGRVLTEDAVKFLAARWTTIAGQ